jgi:hypothetical protein
MPRDASRCLVMPRDATTSEILKPLPASSWITSADSEMAPGAVGYRKGGPSMARGENDADDLMNDDIDDLGVAGGAEDMMGDVGGSGGPESDTALGGTADSSPPARPSRPRPAARKRPAGRARKAGSRKSAGARTKKTAARSARSKKSAKGSRGKKKVSARSQKKSARPARRGATRRRAAGSRGAKKR